MNEDVKSLRSELALLKLQFSERIGSVETRLNNLLEQDQVPNVDITPDIHHVDVNSPQVKALSEPELASESAQRGVEKSTCVSKKQQEVEPAKPSFILVFLQSILSSFFEWISPLTKIYQSYKERGMLGIFILTVVGIGLTLAGFGYLMQLLIDELGAGSKSLLMCFAAIFVLGLGVTLKIKTRFDEFATAIVTLGLLTAYSTVYFSGSVYGLLPSFLVLILYVIIALGCHAIALWLDTKVVAALGVIGIATMPIVSGTIALEPIFYLLSFAFIVCSSLLLAFRHVGHWLAQLSLAFTVLSLEWIIGFENISISAWAIDLFYLLFFIYVVVSLMKDNVPTNKMLVFLAALVASTILLFVQATNMFTMQISLSFTFNALLASAVSVFFCKIKRELVPFFILLAASWGVLAIVSAISDAYWGIAWAIEGLLLLAIGRTYKIPSTVNQGQLLTAVALLYSFSALAIYFPLPALKSIDGWLLSIIIVLVIAIWQRMINKTDVFNKITQYKIKPFLQLLEVIWLTVLIIANAQLLLSNWAGAIVIFIQVALLFRAKYCKQVSIEVFAASLILVPLIFVYQGAVIADSYRFTMLPLFAKVSLISAFLQLWLWSEFYRKYYADSSIKSFAESVRILFYLLIPVCWVGSVVRRFDEGAIMLLWLSPLLALFFARKIGHKLIINETKILTGIASVALILVIAIGRLTPTNTLIALIGFLSLYAISYVLDRKTPNSIYQFICSWGLISFGIALPTLVSTQTHSLLYGIITASFYWTIAFSHINESAHCKRNEAFITVANLMLVIAAWILIPSSINYAVTPLLFLLCVMYKKEQKFKLSLLSRMLNNKSDLFLHSVLAVTYVIVFYSMDNYRLALVVAPALAIHGALILFLKDRQLTTVKYAFGLISLGILKLAFIDASSALLWQKVVLFMGIGVFILFASFWYQKLISRTQSAVIDGI